MRLMHGLVRQHGLTHDVTNGKNMGHVGAHLNVDIDKATVSHRHTCFFSANFFAVGCAAHRLQYQVVGLWRRGCSTLFCGRKRHLNAFGSGFGANGFGFQHDVVKAVGIHFLPHLDQVAICALHQAVHHFHYIEACAQGAVNGPHF